MQITESQASNVISDVRSSLEMFIKAKDDFQRAASALFNLEADKDLSQDHFKGENEGIEVATFLSAFNGMAAILTTAAVLDNTKAIYKVGRK